MSVENAIQNAVIDAVEDVFGDETDNTDYSDALITEDYFLMDDEQGGWFEGEPDE